MSEHNVGVGQNLSVGGLSAAMDNGVDDCSGQVKRSNKADRLKKRGSLYTIIFKIDK